MRAYSSLFIIAALISSGCKEPTPPDNGIQCPLGYHICGEDSQDCCPDTTSHNFIWSVDTLKGDYNYLKDVSIVGANDIWVVGEIRMPEARYNGAHWNGAIWHLEQIQWEVNGQTGTNRLETICFLSSSAAWAADTAPYGFDGSRWISYGTRNSSWDFTGYVYDIWGNDPTDVYFVGDSGSIVHYDGNDFERMSSGTDIRLRSVAGVGNHVFISGFSDQAESVVLELKDGQWQTLLISFNYNSDVSNGDYGMASALDVFADTAYIMTTAGLLKYAYHTEDLLLIPSSIIQTRNTTTVFIKTQAPNDIHLFTYGGRHIHYNGISWKRNEEMAFGDVSEDIYLYHGADFRGNTAAMVGSIGGQGGFVMIGRRME